MSVLYIHSHSGPPPAKYESAVAQRRLVIRRERDLQSADFVAARGLLTTTHLDQLGAMERLEDLAGHMNRGGRWFFNGHIMRPLLPGLRSYVPLGNPRRSDLVMTRLNPHPIFADIDQKDLEENKGVAGFYGRGHNPPPPGALAINGLGPRQVPIDWEWATPLGGHFFSHAGNDLGGMGGDAGHAGLLSERILAWLEGDLP